MNCTRVFNICTSAHVWAYINNCLLCYYSKLSINLLASNCCRLHEVALKSTGGKMERISRVNKLFSDHSWEAVTHSAHAPQLCLGNHYVCSSMCVYVARLGMQPFLELQE